MIPLFFVNVQWGVHTPRQLESFFEAMLGPTVPANIRQAAWTAVSLRAGCWPTACQQVPLLGGDRRVAWNWLLQSRRVHGVVWIAPVQLRHMSVDTKLSGAQHLQMRFALFRLHGHAEAT